MDREIYISATRGEQKHLEDLLSDSLLRLNLDVAVNDRVVVTSGKSLEEIDTKIRDCSVLVHFAGVNDRQIPDAEAVKVLLAKYPDLAAQVPLLNEQVTHSDLMISFTQWEACLALYHRKKVVILQTGESDEIHDPIMRICKDATICRPSAVSIAFALAKSGSILDRWIMKELRNPLYGLNRGSLIDFLFERPRRVSIYLASLIVVLMAAALASSEVPTDIPAIMFFSVIALGLAIFVTQKSFFIAGIIVGLLISIQTITSLSLNSVTDLAAPNRKDLSLTRIVIRNTEADDVLRLVLAAPLLIGSVVGIVKYRSADTFNWAFLDRAFTPSSLEPLSWFRLRFLAIYSLTLPICLLVYCFFYGTSILEVLQRGFFVLVVSAYIPMVFYCIPSASGNKIASFWLTGVVLYFGGAVLTAWAPAVFVAELASGNLLSPFPLLVIVLCGLISMRLSTILRARV